MRARFLLATLLGAAFALGACSSNDLRQPGQDCGDNAPCVSGYTCDPKDHICVITGGSIDAPPTVDAAASPDAAAHPDAAVDAPAAPDAARPDGPPTGSDAPRPDAAVPDAAPDAAPDAPPPTPVLDISSPQMGAFTSTQVTLAWTSTVSVPGFQCKLDAGAFLACGSGLSGSLDLGTINLAAGPHAASVRAVDGAQQPIGVPAVVTWTVDTSGPTFIIDTITSAVNSGTVVVTYRADKPTMSQTCKLDGDLCGTCTADGASCGGAAVGVHVFTVSGSDTSGNPGGETTSKPVVVSYGPNEGHAILIGMDYRVPSAPANTVLHRAFEQVPWRHQGTFDRKIRVAAFRLPTVSDVEATNARAAVEDLIDDDAYEEFTNSTDIATALAGHDLLLVYDQQDPEDLVDVGAAWEPTLRAFLNEGGVVVVLDGLQEDGVSLSVNLIVIDARAGDDPPILFVDDLADIRQLPAGQIFAFQDDIVYVTNEASSPLEVLPPFDPPNATIVYDVSEDNEQPRLVDGTNFSQGDSGPLLVPTVIDKIFPVYNFTTDISETVGPAVPFNFDVTQSTTYDHIDCVVRNLSCDVGAAAPGCLCSGSQSVCSCDGDNVSGFSVPFVASGSYQVTMRVIDPFGRPGRGTVAQFSIDLPSVSITPNDLEFGTTSGVFCFAGSTIDKRQLHYRLLLDGVAVTRDATTDKSCAPGDVGSYSFFVCQDRAHTFEVQAIDTFGNTGTSAVSWQEGCAP